MNGNIRSFILGVALVVVALVSYKANLDIPLFQGYLGVAWDVIIPTAAWAIGKWS